MLQLRSLLLTALVAFSSCQQPVKDYYMFDPHSAARPNDAVTTHLEWEAEVRFEKKQIIATAHWVISHKPGVKEIIFDTDGLNIERVWLDDGDSTNWRLGKEQAYIGSALVVKITDNTQMVHIRYTTGEEAKGLQWLEPGQTHDKSAPFLFTQGQAVLTRSWLPCQDSPGIRFSFAARVQVPEGLFAIMSAVNPRQHEDNGIYRFKNDKAIPAYLFALAVGNISFKPYDGRSGVYAEPGMLQKAWWEFAELPAMIRAAEQEFGPYPWDRYDVLVLPPSFPFGGMENPMIMFATPTIIAGDRSLTNLIAHELSHSWSGNLITNATWNDFWINEGFTTYIERRIIELIHGPEYAEMLQALGNQDLEVAIAESSHQPELTALKLALEGKNPDDALSIIPYQKGFAFLKMIEKEVGRSRMDSFIKANYAAHAFSSMTTEDFLAFLRSNLLNDEQFERLQINNWVYAEGLPSNYQRQSSIRFSLANEAVALWEDDKPLLSLPTAGWSTYEWIYFFRKIEPKASASQLEALDEAFEFSNSGNAELLTAWFVLSIKKNHEAAYPQIEKFLQTVGRRKLLVPVYRELMAHKHSGAMGLNWYSKFRVNYHQVSRNTLDVLVGYPIK
ncbi:MAG: M1 family metallopeptidase [Sphingobacteriaceae bacterium]|nr:M1 family metallopeptidase [Sphingobacteriaceae bacterium]